MAYFLSYLWNWCFYERHASLPTWVEYDEEKNLEIPKDIWEKSKENGLDE